MLLQPLLQAYQILGWVDTFCAALSSYHLYISFCTHCIDLMVNSIPGVSPIPPLVWFRLTYFYVISDMELSICL